jgi:hypothetical protein
VRRAAFLFLVPLAPVVAITIAAADVMHDPPPLVSKTQWVFDLRWDSGDVYLLGVRKIELPAPMSTPRAMGRFAIELTEHGILVERTRFDFPGLAVPDEEGGVRMNQKLRTRIGVFFPVTPRGDKLELVDRSTGRRFALPWPPENATPSDGGVEQ